MTFSLYYISKFHVGAEHFRAAALGGGPRGGADGAGGRGPPGGGEGGDGMGVAVEVASGRWRAEEVQGEAAGSFEKFPPEDLHRGDGVRRSLPLTAQIGRAHV